MNLPTLAKRILRYSGVNSLDASVGLNNININSLEAGMLDDVAACINGALQEMFAMAPASMRERRVGIVLRAPTTIRLTLTQYSATMSVAAGAVNTTTIDDFAGTLAGIAQTRSNDATIASPVWDVAASRTIYASFDGGGSEWYYEVYSDATGTGIGSGVVAAGGGTITFAGGSFTIGNLPSGITGRWHIIVVRDYDAGAESPWADRMQGCTVQIAGDSQFNELLNATTLQRPYMGPSGRATGTVYHDTLRLDADIETVLTPVQLGRRTVTMMATREDFDGFTGVVHGALHEVLRSGMDYEQRRTGEPMVALVDALFAATSPDGVTAATTLPLFFRVYPMPDTAYPVTLRVRKKPIEVLTASIVEGGTVGIPVSWIEGVLLPFALQRWTSTPSAVFTAVQAREISRQYMMARAIMQRGVPSVGGSGTVKYHKQGGC